MSLIFAVHTAVPGGAEELTAMALTTGAIGCFTLDFANQPHGTAAADPSGGGEPHPHSMPPGHG